MLRGLHGLLAVAGVVVIVANKQFAKSSARASRDYFGRDVRVGSREHAFMSGFSRVMAVLVGGVLVVTGLLGALGVIWNE